MNDLIVVDKIEKRLQEPRKEVVFPLSPTHRKELRTLRNENVGNLKERLRTIKQLKKEEYVRKYVAQIEKEICNKEKICEKLNKDWELRITKIHKLLQERKELEDSTDINYLQIQNDYSDICNLRKIEKKKRLFVFEKKKISEEIAEEEFNKKYESKFENVSKKIEDVVTKYEEAINFGDLEIVKELYYIMKRADKFFEKVEQLEV